MCLLFNVWEKKENANLTKGLALGTRRFWDVD